MSTIVIGFALSFAISFAAYKKRSLSESGLIFATMLGVSLYYFGGLFFWMIMISFFLSSSALSHYKTNLKSDFETMYEKGSKRDYTQVLANGLPGFVFALMYHITGNQAYMVAFATAMASSNADTWASELGVLSTGKTVSLITWKPVKKGLSGGVSLLGTAAAFCGSLFVAIIFLIGYSLLYGFGYHAVTWALICTMGGFLGSIIDSILGSTIQAKYRTDSNKITEKRVDKGHVNRRISGLPFFNNDMVNFVSGAVATLLILMVFQLL